MNQKKDYLCKLKGKRIIKIWERYDDKEECLNRVNVLEMVNLGLKEMNYLKINLLEAIRDIISMWVDGLYHPFSGSLKSNMSIESRLTLH